jgi:hypothetical protein
MPKAKSIHDGVTDRMLRVLWAIGHDPHHWEERQRRTPKAFQGRLKAIEALRKRGWVELHPKGMHQARPHINHYIELPAPTWMLTEEGQAVLGEFEAEAFTMALRVWGFESRAKKWERRNDAKSKRAARERE